MTLAAASGGRKGSLPVRLAIQEVSSSISASIQELNQLLAENSDTDQGEPEQEQSRHAEAEHRACLAGDCGDRAGSHYEPRGGEMAAQEV